MNTIKRTILLLIFLMGFIIQGAFGQADLSETKENETTSLGIVIYSNDIETVWNAMRFANFSKNQGDVVSIFLLGKGVELDDLAKTDEDIKYQTDTFLENGGEIMGCGTCLQSRKNNEPQVCKYSSMKDLYELVHKNDIVLTF